MFSSTRARRTLAAISALVAAGGIATAATTVAAASPRPAPRPAPHQPKLSLNRLDLSGLVINTDYTLGTNTGNTFQQTYSPGGTVLGVPIAGPNVGVVFPTDDYVAVPISSDQLYVTWLDPSTDAIVDVFVFNFATHTVFDYAPGSTPESAGTITVVHRGKTRLP